MALTRPKYSQIYDTDWKQSAEVATTGDVGNLVLGNVQPNSIDGVTVQNGYRILVKDQTAGAQNGLYIVANVGTGSNGYWQRTLDARQSEFVTAGLTVTVVSGTTNGGKEFRLTTPDPITLGTTALTFINPFATAAPAGANTQVQFNDQNVTNATAGLAFNKYTNALSVGGSITASTLTITESGVGNQYALIMKGANTGDQWAFTVGNIAGQNNISSLNNAGSAYASFTVNGSSFIANTKGVSATTSLIIDNSGNTNVYGNLIIATGSGQFNGPYNESTTAAGVYAGNLNLSPRIGFFNGTASQNWQIDNNFGIFRWYTPGVTRMTLDTNGNLSIPSSTTATSVTTGALQVTGGISSQGNIYAVTHYGNIGGVPDIYITGNILPTANITYNLGSPTSRFKTGYFSANTIDLGGSQISVDPVNGFSFSAAGASPIYMMSNGAMTSNTFTASQVTFSSTTNSVPYQLGSGAIYVAGGMSIAKDIWVSGNIYAGNLISTTANILTSQDSLVYLQNPITYPYNYSIGMYGHFVGGPANVYAHTAMIRNYTDNSWYFISNIAEPTVNGNINVSDSNRIFDPIYSGTHTVNGFVNVTGNVIASAFIGNGALLTGIVTGAAGAKFTTANSAPSSPSINDVWYDTSTDIVFLYENTGAGGNVWVDYTSVALNTNIATVQGATLSITGNATIGTTLSSGAHTITGSPTTAIVNGGTSGVGNIGASGAAFNTVFAKASSAQYADLAEKYTSDYNYTSGTVLVFGGTQEVTVTTQSHDPRVAGVVTTDPAYLMNDSIDGIAVALTGRVPCRVLGPINKGDRLVTSEHSGVAQRLNKDLYEPGCIIGKSLETIESAEIHTIEIAIGRF
jgi:hypothetical protein